MVGIPQIYPNLRCLKPQISPQLMFFIKTHDVLSTPKNGWRLIPKVLRTQLHTSILDCLSSSKTRQQCQVPTVAELQAPWSNASSYSFQETLTQKKYANPQFGTPKSPRFET